MPGLRSASLPWFLRAAVGLSLLVLMWPASAAQPVIVDQVGDAKPDPCDAAYSCSWVEGESQPAADITAVNVVSARPELVVDVSYVDIDRPIPGVGAADTVTDSVTFTVGPPRAYPWVAVWLSASRDFAGKLKSSTAEVSVSGPDGGRRLTGLASVDATANRLRFSVPIAVLNEAIGASCRGCARLAPGTTLRDFFAHSRASVVLAAAGVGLVGHTAANDDGWPGNRAYEIR